MDFNKIKDAILRSQKALTTAGLYLDNLDSASSRRALQRSRRWAALAEGMQSASGVPSARLEEAYDLYVQEEDAELGVGSADETEIDE